MCLGALGGTLDLHAGESIQGRLVWVGNHFRAALQEAASEEHVEWTASSEPCSAVGPCANAGPAAPLVPCLAFSVAEAADPSAPAPALGT